MLAAMVLSSTHYEPKSFSFHERETKKQTSPARTQVSYVSQRVKVPSFVASKQRLSRNMLSWILFQEFA
ncbi:hypothetical protein V6N12_015676 [Hibiscus sabdariffa]|uniref:Uncharacterized protein n=1 Tax=Hibiscus sabdariffa TaxID=183260 RepID=A0ABR2DPT9_9ROSI